jgi:hypothetical protein
MLPGLMIEVKLKILLRKFKCHILPADEFMFVYNNIEEPNLMYELRITKIYATGCSKARIGF